MCAFLPRILAFFPAMWGLYSQVYDHFLTNAHIYAHKKAHIYAFSSPEPLGLICNRKRRALGTRMIYIRYKQACVYGVTESRRIRRNELYRQQKTHSCTMELKSNFSLNSAWPQWPRLSRARFGSYSLPSQ